MTKVFAILCGVFILIPCALWCIIGFIEKNKRTSYYWKKKTLIFSFLISFLIAIIFLILAILY